jgi:hypothetical protein
MHHLELLITLAIFIGLPAVCVVLAYKWLSSMFSSSVADSQAELEEAKRERLAEENDNLRLQMLREKQARRRAQAAGPSPEAYGITLETPKTEVLGPGRPAPLGRATP